MSEMVERGIRALALVNEQNGAAPYESFAALYGESGARRIREQLAEQVRAVIEAMREPTKGMLDAVDPRKERMMGCGYSWQAMIDAALK